MLKNNKDSKIKPWSRYYDHLLNLKSIFSERRVFKLVDRGEKGYSLPYLFKDYKNELNPVSDSNKIVSSVKQYFDENLFRIEERKLLLSELIPSIEKFGLKTIKLLNSETKRIKEKEEIIRNTPEYSGYIELIPEYEKTIEALQKIREIIIIEFSKNFFMEANTGPEVFISYSHDSEEHKDWVLQLATRLRSNGVNVILDRWNLKLGSNLAYFMERGLSNSNRVICVCSEFYIKKANGGLGGAGYEKQIITSELIKDQNTDWVIPLIKNNSTSKKTPIFLAGRLYIDFEKQHLYEKNYEELLILTLLFFN